MGLRFEMLQRALPTTRRAVRTQRRIRWVGARLAHSALCLIVLVIGFEAYRAISLAAPRRTPEAHRHAAVLIGYERRLGLLVEPRLQHLALHGLSGDMALPLRALISLLYGGGQLPWLCTVLIWLYLFRRPHFKRLCLAAIITSLLAILFAAIYPVAPPRFALSGPPYWVEDVTGVPDSEQALVRIAGFNPYASLPSIHVLWALLTGMGLWLGAPSHVTRLLSALFPATIILVVVLTGNHYLLDCLGSVVLLVGYLLAQAGCSRLWARRHRGAATVWQLASGGIERRRNPNLRPLDSPLLLCAGMAVVLLACPAWPARAVGVLLLALGLAVPSFARRRILAGAPLCPRAPLAEWWCGALCVAGVTILGAGETRLAPITGVLWFGGALLLLQARLRLAPRIGGRAPACSRSRALRESRQAG